MQADLQVKNESHGNHVKSCLIQNINTN